MGKVLYSASMSLDGYIAGPEGDMSWLTPYLGPNPQVDELQRGIGALLIGGRTFRGDDPNRGTDQEGAFSGTWTGPSFVVTHRPPADPPPGLTFCSDVASGVAAAKDAAGDAYVNVLGADLARQCLELGELDEVLVVIAPLLLGEGTRLFQYPGGRRVRLERLDVQTVPQGTNVWMRVIDSGRYRLVDRHRDSQLLQRHRDGAQPAQQSELAAQQPGLPRQPRPGRGQGK
jgi:dihydrofolate reductase